MIYVGKLKIKCKRCGRILGTLEELFKFSSWICNEDKEEELISGGLENLTHIHLSCYCDEYGGDGILSLKLDDDSEFEVVK